jgi:hypothetical protein
MRCSRSSRSLGNAGLLAGDAAASSANKRSSSGASGAVFRVVIEVSGLSERVLALDEKYD